MQIVGPIESHYVWKGKRKMAKEFLCIIKTKASLYKKVERVIKEVHTYKTPEIVAMPIVFGSKDYFKWLNSFLS